MEEDDELFEVECFLNTRVKDGKRYYKVRWKGFPPEEDTWEPEENVLECEEALEAFWRKKRKNASKRQRMRRYRLMSEEEDPELPSTSHKASELFDIKPLGLTRQASKELAMCLNKSRNTTKRNSESSSQAGSDVTMAENDVSSKSTLASLETGCDITASDNDFSSQGLEFKSSETGSDVLDQSSNEIYHTNDVIDSSSQESPSNQSEFEFSPRKTSSRNQTLTNVKAVEVISLLSDSEDAEGESSGIGSKLLGTQSPEDAQSSCDSTPVVQRQSFKTPSNSSQSNEPRGTEKAADQPPDVSPEQLQTPGTAKDRNGDAFGTPVRRKKRFELSLKKSRKRKLSNIESSSSESPKTEEEVLDADVKTDVIISDENVLKSRGKNQIETLKESMLALEEAEKTSEKSDRFPETSEPRTKRALIQDTRLTNRPFDDKCPTIIELKGIMHNIARNRYEHHVEGNVRDRSKVDGVENEGFSGESCESNSVVFETSKIFLSGDKNILPGKNDLREEQNGKYWKSIIISDNNDEQTTKRKDEEKMNATISKNCFLNKTVEDEDLKGVKEDEVKRKERLSCLEKDVEEDEINREERLSCLEKDVEEDEVKRKERLSCLEKDVEEDEVKRKERLSCLEKDVEEDEVKRKERLSCLEKDVEEDEINREERLSCLEKDVEEDEVNRKERLSCLEKDVEEDEIKRKERLSCLEKDVEEDEVNREERLSCLEKDVEEDEVNRKERLSCLEKDVEEDEVKRKERLSYLEKDVEEDEVNHKERLSCLEEGVEEAEVNRKEELSCLEEDVEEDEVNREERLSCLEEDVEEDEVNREERLSCLEKDVEEDEVNRKERLSCLEKDVEEDEVNREERLSYLEKDVKEKVHTKKRTMALKPSSTRKAVILSSESTTRVLKNLRFLAAKRRRPMSIETTSSTTSENKKELNDSKVESEVNSQNKNTDSRNYKSSVEEESNVGTEKNLNEKENKRGRKIEGENGVKKGNESKNPQEERNQNNDELGLINSKVPIYEDSARVDNDCKSNIEDYCKYRELNNSRDKTENMTNVGRSTDDETVEEKIGQEIPTSQISRVESIEKNCCPKGKVDNFSKSFDSEISTDVSTSKTPNSSPVAKSFSIHYRISCQGRLGDESIDEPLALNFQNHSTVESSAVDEKRNPKINRSKKILKKSNDKPTPVKLSVKRKKTLQSKTKSWDSKNLHPNEQCVEHGNSSNDCNSQNSKRLKRTKAKEHHKMNKTEDINTTVKPSQNAPEQSKKTLISDGNFSSSLTSGDLIGAIIDEDRKISSKHEQRKSRAPEKRDSNALIAERQEKDMIEDDEDFDFELEDFPLEKLLQEEDDIDLRSIPSPPVEPMEVPFASVKTAIRDGDEMTVRAALAGGLELDTLDGASGMTLLMLAAASGQDGVVELLLRRKADVHACQKNGMTALMHACEQGYPETAHVLLLCGADINKQQIAGETALMKACKKGHTDVVEVLLKNGADTRVESKSGHTAHQFAIRGYPELSSLIEEHEKRLGRVVEEAVLKCLGDTVSLCKPAILNHRCVVPREGQQMTFPFHYTPQIYTKEVDVILFCIKAVFDDVVSLLFGEDNGVRGILLNNRPQIPLLHGVRSIFSIDPKSRQNTMTLQTHKCSNPASRIIVCIYAVQSKS